MGDVRKPGQLPEKNEKEHPVKIVPNSSGDTGIGDFVKNA
jgi:hypothetical protein